MADRTDAPSATHVDDARDLLWRADEEGGVGWVTVARAGASSARGLGVPRPGGRHAVGSTTMSDREPVRAVLTRQ
jgi:hypothetical protein